MISTASTGCKFCGFSLSEDTRNPEDFYVPRTRMLMYAKKIMDAIENLRYKNL